MTHPDQADLSAYVAGATDGDGSIVSSVTESTKGTTHRKISPKVTYAFYISGLLDSDGCINQCVRRNDRVGLGYKTNCDVRVKIIQKGSQDVRQTFIKYFENLGVDYGEAKDEGRGNRYDRWRIYVSSISSVDTLLRELRPHLRIKKEQANIMIDEILPRLRKGVHHDKRGFLRVMAWRDAMNLYKGGNRGKYNLRYFEDEWDIKANLDDLGLPADLRGRIASQRKDSDS